MTRNRATQEMLVNEQIFVSVLRGSGGRHVYSTYAELTANSPEEKIKEGERDFGISAWQKDIGIVTPPLLTKEAMFLKVLFREAGYHVCIKNEEDSYGVVLLRYTLISVVRQDVVAT